MNLPTLSVGKVTVDERKNVYSQSFVRFYCGFYCVVEGVGELILGTHILLDIVGYQINRLPFVAVNVHRLVGKLHRLIHIASLLLDEAGHRAL